jgi:hypothetical protein
LSTKVKIGLYNFNTSIILGMESSHASNLGRVPSKVPQMIEGKFRASFMQLGKNITKAPSHTLSLHKCNLKSHPFPLSICCYSLHFATLPCISNFKVLGKQSFSICFQPASCFMEILFHLFCKVGTTNMNNFFA